MRSAPVAAAPVELDVHAGAVALTRQLCDIPSESGDERVIADAVERALREHAPHLEVVRDGNAVIAATQLGRSRRVAIAGHLDTVPIAHNVPVTEVPSESGAGSVLWGRGTVDMKAGVAVQLALAVELTAPSIDVTWIWYDNEEVESHLNGLARVLEHHPRFRDVDLAILGEPSRSAIEAGCNGTLTVRAVFHGKRAHTARSWNGVNAIHRMADTLRRLAAYEPASPHIDGLVFHEGVQATACHSGVAANVVPDRAELEINYRFAPNKSGADAERVLRELCVDCDEFLVTDLAEGALPGTDSPAVRALLSQLGEDVSAKQGWTDVARFRSFGIPAVNFGPGDPLLAHADDERIETRQIDRAFTQLRTWLTG